MNQMINYILSHNRLILKAAKRSRELESILGSHKVFSSENSTNFRVSLTGSIYHLSFAYIYGRKEGSIETALIGTNNSVIYIDSLDYTDVLVHEDTVEACLEEINRVENLLNTFANTIKKAWLNYKRKKEAAIMIQRAYRQARDDPTYMLCEQIQMRHLDDIGCQTF